MYCIPSRVYQRASQMRFFRVQSCSSAARCILCTCRTFTSIQICRISSSVVALLPCTGALRRPTRSHAESHAFGVEALYVNVHNAQTTRYCCRQGIVTLCWGCSAPSASCFCALHMTLCAGPCGCACVGSLGGCRPHSRTASDVIHLHPFCTALHMQRERGCDQNIRSCAATALGSRSFLPFGASACLRAAARVSAPLRSLPVCPCSSDCSTLPVHTECNH